jgi:hypothetical protein
VSRSHATRRHTVALVTLTIGVMLLVAEIALRLVSPLPNPYEPRAGGKPAVNQYIRFEYPVNYTATTRAEPGLPGLTGTNRFTTNNAGFRGDSLIEPKPPGEFRVFIVGGSTTECFYVDDKDDMARVVQNELAAVAPAGIVPRVYNVGMSGAASDDHVAMISQRLVHMQPDLIVVFCGINDLTRSIYHYDYRHYFDYNPALHVVWYKRFLMHFQMARRLFALKQRVTGTGSQRLQEQRTLVTNYAGLVGLLRSVPASDIPPRTDEGSYATNLRSMIGLAKSNHVRFVYMTQATTWNSRVDPAAKDHHWMRYRAGAPGARPGDDGVTFREDLMDAAMERLNNTMRAVSAEESVPMYDLARVLPKSLEYFYDDCHFNTAGSLAAGKGLAAFLVAAGTFSNADGGIGTITDVPKE